MKAGFSEMLTVSLFAHFGSKRANFARIFFSSLRIISSLVTFRGVLLERRDHSERRRI